MEYQALPTFLLKNIPRLYYLDKLKIVYFLLVLFPKNGEVHIALRIGLQVYQQ